MNKISQVQVFLVIAVLLQLLPSSSSLSTSQHGNFLETFLTQSHNSSVLSVFLGTGDESAESADNDDPPKIEPRSDVSLGIGVLASNLFLSLSNALSLLLGFIFRKKVEVLISLAAVLAPVLYLNMGSQSNNTVEPPHPLHHTDLGPDHLHKEGRFVGSLISSLFSTVAWPFEYLLMPLEYILSFVVSPSPSPLPSPSPPVSVSSEQSSEVTDKIKDPLSLPNLAPHQTSHSAPQDSEKTPKPDLSPEELQQMVEGGVADYLQKFEEEISLIRTSLLGPVTGIDLETVTKIEEKYGPGTWDSTLASITQPSAQSQSHLFYQELHTVLGEFASELVSIKRDVWANVQQYEHLQREILDVKISALHGAVQAAIKERKGRSYTGSDDLVREIFQFLDTSSISPQQDSADGKVAQLWNIGLELHDLLEETLQLGVSTVLQDSLAAKQVVEISLLEKSGKVAALVLSLSDLALQVEEVRAAELEALNTSLQGGTVALINNIATLSLSPAASGPDHLLTIPVDTVPINTNNKTHDKESLVNIPDPADIQETIVENIDNSSKEKLSNFNEKLDDHESKIENIESLPEVVSNNLKAEIQEIIDSGVKAEEVLGDLFDEKEIFLLNENSSSVSVSTPLSQSTKDTPVTSSGLTDLLDQSSIPAQLSLVVKDVLKSSAESKKADVESITIILFSSPLILDPVKTELIDSKLGHGAWNNILSSLSLQQAPSFRNSQSGDTKLLTEILNESIGKVLRELASLSHDISDLMSEINNLQSKITDTKIMALVEAVSKVDHQSSIFKIPGVLGSKVNNKFSEDVQRFLTPSGINIDTLKISLFNFAFEMNQLKLQVVDSAISSVIENTADLSDLKSQTKADLSNSVKQSIQSTEAEIEFLVMSLFDLTIQIDEAKRDDYLHTDTTGLSVVLDKISAFNEISVTVSSGVVDEDSITLIKTILNNRLLNHANPLEYIEVIDLFKLPKISVEKQDENTSNSVYSDLLGLHEG